MCDSPCSVNCSLNCEIESGICTNGCKPNTCGAQCDDSCPDNCLDGLCDQREGSCTKVCHMGWYGDVCNFSCIENYSSFCEHNSEFLKSCPTCEQYNATETSYGVKSGGNSSKLLFYEKKTYFLLCEIYFSNIFLKIIVYCILYINIVFNEKVN